MNKVFQTIIDKGHGNCMQAAIASLFDLELNDVPNFIELGDKWFSSMYKLCKDNGYDICNINRNKEDNTEFLQRVAKFDGGVNGYLYATVKSQTFDNVSHAVIIDLDLNIVHDPNPNQLALKLTPDDVISFMSMHDMVIGKTGKLFTLADWDAATDDEKDENVHHATLNTS